MVANLAASALEAGGEGGGEGHLRPPGAERAHLRPPVQPGPGARQHRVDRPPVWAGRGGGPPGLGPLGGGGDRRRPGPVGTLSRAPLGVQGPGGAGVPGRGRRHLRPGGLPPGPLLGRSVPPAGAGPPHRHAGGRRRRHLRPGQLQRPPPAGPEGHDVRGRAAPVGRPAPGRQAGRGRAGRAPLPAAGRLRLRRRGRHDDGP